MTDRPDRPDSEPCDLCGGPTPGDWTQFCDGCCSGSSYLSGWKTVKQAKTPDTTHPTRYDRLDRTG